MRHTASRQHLRRQVRHHVNRPARTAGVLAAFRRWGRHSALAAIVVTLLVSAGTLLGAGAPAAGTAHARALARPADATVLGRWRDAANGTALVIANPQALAAGALSSKSSLVRVQFLLPTGDIIVLVPGPSLDQLLAALLAQPAGTAFDQQSSDCVAGFLLAGAQSAAFPSKTGSGVANVLVGLVMHVGRAAGDDTLLAYAGLSYFAPGNDSNCTPSSPQFELLAGCNANSCFPPLPPAASVARYDTAVVNAVASQDWGPVYILSAAAITAQYTTDQFTTAMNQQVRALGRITAISPVSDAQVTRQTRDGQQFFSAPQTVTLVDRQGATTTRTITSYYLFEEGSWRFWFSA